MRARTYQGAVIASTPPRGVHFSQHRARTGGGTFFCREDFDLIAQVIATKRRIAARTLV